MVFTLYFEIGANLNNCKTILCTELGPAQCYSTDPVGFRQPASSDCVQRDSALSRRCSDRCRRRVSLLPRLLHAPHMPPPVSDASSRCPGCDLTRATVARSPATSRPTLQTSCHHRSTCCTCSHRSCTLPPHHRSGGKVVYSSSHNYRRALTPPLMLTIAAVPRLPSTAASGPPPATPAPPRAPPRSRVPHRPLLPHRRAPLRPLTGAFLPAEITAAASPPR
jgi:hypothetical protein